MWRRRDKNGSSKKDFINITESEVRQGSDNPPRVTRTNTARAILRTDDWWLWEVAGLLLSLAALSGMAGFLLSLNNKPQPDWSFTAPVKHIHGKTIGGVKVALSPNAILSVLSTLCRICIAIPITRGLAQLKWVWFAEDNRDLSDFEAFQKASSLAGSASLIWKLRFRHFAVIAAGATLLLVAFDPFIQNLLEYHNEMVPDPTTPAQLARATRFDANSYPYGGSPSNELMATMKAAIIAGYSKTTGYNVPNYHCVTSNCTWSNTHTLGVCAKCQDVTTYLRTSCQHVNDTAFANSTINQRCTFSLPNNFTLDTLPARDVSVHANVSVHEDVFVFTKYPSPIAKIHAIYGGHMRNRSTVDWFSTADWNHKQVWASECILIPCVQTYESAIGSWENLSGKGKAKGVSVVFTDEVQNEYHDYYIDAGVNGTNASTPSNTTIASLHGNVANAAYWLRPNSSAYGGETYKFHLNGVFQIRSFLSQILGGTVQVWADSKIVHYIGERVSNSSTQLSDSLFIQYVFTSMMDDVCDGYSRQEKLRVQCAIRNMALAMTTYIRNYGGANLDYQSIQRLIDGSNERLSGAYQSAPFYHVAHGTTLINKTYITVSWIWLTLPTGLWTLALIVFVGTVWKTRMAGVRTWRGSALAPLFLPLGVGEEHLEKIEMHDMSTDGLEKKAEILKVRLHVTDYEARFVAC